MYQSRSRHRAVTLLADDSRGIGSTPEMLALSEKRAGESRRGEERLGRHSLCRNNLSHQAATFRDKYLPSRRAPDPPPRSLMKFPYRNRFHVTHCVTFFNTLKSPPRFSEQRFVVFRVGNQLLEARLVVQRPKRRPGHIDVHSPRHVEQALDFRQCPVLQGRDEGLQLTLTNLVQLENFACVR